MHRAKITPHLIERDARAEVVHATEHEIHRAANFGACGDLPATHTHWSMGKGQLTDDNDYKVSILVRAGVRAKARLSIVVQFKRRLCFDSTRDMNIYHCG